MCPCGDVSNADSASHLPPCSCQNAPAPPSPSPIHTLTTATLSPQVLSNTGSGTTTTIMNGLDWVAKIAKDPYYNVKVVSMSIQTTM